MNLPNREELLFRDVFALPIVYMISVEHSILLVQCRILCISHTKESGIIFLPKLSRILFVSRIICSIHPLVELTVVRNCKISLVLSVLPAPDSPDMMTD